MSFVADQNTDRDTPRSTVDFSASPVPDGAEVEVLVVPVNEKGKWLLKIPLQSET